MVTQYQENVKKVVFEPLVIRVRPKNTVKWFNGYKYLEDIQGMEYLNTSEVTDMCEMFFGCRKLTTLDLSHFDTRKVTNMNCMFDWCDQLTTLNLESFNTSKVTNMESMFWECSNLVTIMIGDEWDTSKVTQGDAMFHHCTSIVGQFGTTYDRNKTDKSMAHARPGGYMCKRISPITLSDNSSNIETIASAIAIDKKYNVMLKGRTFHLDGDWNTLCLPFTLNNLTGTPLEGFTVKELDIDAQNGGHKTGIENGTLYLNFKDATSMEAGKPYIVKKKDVEADLVICSDDDWSTFARNVSNGASYEGQVVRLGADISVSTMAGTSDCPFKGTFDGNGHTISLNLKGGGEGLALFYAIDGATIQNVKVTGAITSSYHRPATFTSFVGGNSTIRNCWSSVDIVSTHNNAWIDGGAFISRVNSDATLNMLDCAFTGSVTYQANTYSGGGMVGFTQSGATANLTNCLFSPSALTLTVKAYNPCIFVSGDERGHLTNCYYNAVAKASVLANEGIDGSGMGADALATALGNNWEASGNNALPYCTSDIHNPIFAGVTINSADPATVTSKDGAVRFSGNYAPVSIGNKGDNTMLCMGPKSTLYYPNAAMSINAFRGCFQLTQALTDPNKGDVNGDGSISVTDVTFLVDKILGNVNDNFVMANADVNGDGFISVSDVTALVDIILGENSGINVVVNGADGLTFGGPSTHFL